MACDNLLWINKNTNDKELIQTAVKGIGFYHRVRIIRTSYHWYYRPVHLRTETDRLLPGNHETNLRFI